MASRAKCTSPHVRLQSGAGLNASIAANAFTAVRWRGSVGSFTSRCPSLPHVFLLDIVVLLFDRPSFIYHIRKRSGSRTLLTHS